MEWQHNKEKSSQARQMLDNKKIGSCTLHCEFVSTSILTFEELQSRCLYVDHLPPDYSSETELSNILSRVKSPTFFKVSLVFHYLTRRRMSPSSDPAEPVVAGFVPGFVRACTENLVNRF